MATKQGLTNHEREDLLDLRNEMQQSGVKAARLAEADPDKRSENYLRSWLTGGGTARPDIVDLKWMAAGLGEPVVAALVAWLLPGYQIVKITAEKPTADKIGEATGNAAIKQSTAHGLRLVSTADGIMDSAEEARCREADELAERALAEAKGAAYALTLDAAKRGKVASGR